MLVTGVAAPLQAQVLPLDQKNTINDNWLVYEPGATQLSPYIADLHTDYNAVHQWVSITPAQPFAISFTAKKEQCVYLNNQLIFVADSALNYSLDLTAYLNRVKPVEGRYLLTVWHPYQHPDVSTFKNKVQEQENQQQSVQRPFSVMVREIVNQNVFILFLLLIGLLYGALKASFPSDFNDIFSLGSFSHSSIEQGFLSKPITWSVILFILTFSLSLALLIGAIHTNVQHFVLFNRLFPVSEADITTKILFYSVAIFLFILIKYLFLRIMGFIFGLEQLVLLQYREFLRTILFWGMLLPVIMLLYLSFNITQPETVLLISNLAVTLLLIFTIIRIFTTVNKKASVLNLHLFSYLCATEVIPLAIILKLIVFNY
ncbi:DUF4271 domain-containing protein [Pontibacter qinzhouensis]|uniref:DUF4271 domain-containing protein n=1 Tax=Pontibacter qinzhouensis TaxID=2603253 RepID=UPI0021029D8B|nr:DUF4271 domain-containing protein [Pontibacter qinzhouensis]